MAILSKIKDSQSSECETKSDMPFCPFHVQNYTDDSHLFDHTPAVLTFQR